MKRPAVLVLLLTIVALVVASLWVPCEVSRGPAFPVVEWTWLWNITDGWFASSEPRAPIGLRIEIMPGWLAVQLGLILAVGGLLALALHLRARRREEDKPI